jgi:hypothetical protein
MLSNGNNMINLSNYEEYFILYMDNELPADEKLMVEAFIAQHPHLGEELEVLMNTKLPLHDVLFTGKEELLSPSMKVNTVDEHLLLYIDNELPSSAKEAVEQNIAESKDYALQYATLLQTKLHPSDVISHPNKKELYRHTEKVVAFKSWMRIAAVVLILLFGSLFFLLSKQEQTIAPATASNGTSTKIKPVETEKVLPVEETIAKENPVPTEQTIVVWTKDKKELQPIEPPTRKESVDQEMVSLTDAPDHSLAHEQRKREVVAFKVKQFTQPQISDVAVKEILAHNPVTSIPSDRNIVEDTPEGALTDADFKNTKRSSAKGLFRKVTRFIGRNTGIGTADVGEEVLIGAVALKLK